MCALTATHTRKMLHLCDIDNIIYQCCGCGSGIRRCLDPGWMKKQDPDHISKSMEISFFVKNN
jgi:hypothetical protein